MDAHIAPAAFVPLGAREEPWPWTAEHRAQLHRLFAPRSVRPGVAAAPPDRYTPPVNAYAAGDTLTVEVLLPGISPQDVEVTLERGVLTLAATRHGPAPGGGPPGQTWYAREFAPGVATRALRLPFPVAVDAVTADFAHGLLTITAPKAPAAQARTIAIGGGRPPGPPPAPATG